MDKRLTLFALSLLSVVASSSAISACSLNKSSSSSVEETPYIASNGNWWIGNKDLGVVATGNSGATPTIGENGNWWIGETDTGVAATGEKGEDGVDGKDGTSCQFGEGAPSFDFGDDGDSYIDTLTYDFFQKEEGLWKKIGNLKGSDGENGTSGINGKDGSSLLVGHGKPILVSAKDGDSYIDLDSYSFYKKESGAWHLIGVFKGIDGKDGTDGKDGANGSDGQDGVDGTNGSDGKDGTDAVNGAISIAFYNYDGSLLQIGSIPYGGEAVYKGGTPVKHSDGNLAYSFKGWDKSEMKGLIVNTSFTAQYSERSFSGEDSDFSFSFINSETEYSLDSYSGNDDFVDVPASHLGKPVTAISDFAFASLSSITGINLPSSIVSVGKDAFASCSSLHDIVLHSTFSKFPMNALINTPYYEDPSSWSNDCLFVKNYTSGGKILLGKKTHITDGHVFYSDKLVIDNDVEAIANDFFFYDDSKVTSGSTFAIKKVSSVFVPKNVQLIGDMAFYYCKNLKTITFETGSKLTSIGKYAFFNAGLTTISFPEGLKHIGSASFSSNPLVGELVIPASLETLGDAQSMSIGTFEGVGLESVSFFSPSSLQNIGPSSFKGCGKMSSISLPVDFTGTISRNAFSDCPLLETVGASIGATKIDTRAFYNDTKLRLFPFSNSLVSIESEAFSGCSSLSSELVFGKELTNLGSNCFYGCASLRSVDFTGNLMEKVPDYCFANSGIIRLTLSTTTKTIGQGSFFSCTQLTSLKISDESLLKTISLYSFKGCTLLNDVFISSSVTDILTSAFEGCTALKTLRLTSFLTTLGSKAFSDCGKLETITYKGNQEEAKAFFTSSRKSSCFSSYVSIAINGEDSGTTWLTF